MSKIVEEIKEFIVNKLGDYEGSEYYLCDLGMTLSDGENADGSWYCSTYQAKQEVIENWDLCGEFYNYYKDNFGDTEGLENPFDDVEKFHCQMMIFAVSNSFCWAVSQIENYSSHDIWNDKIEITEDFIVEIEKALVNLSESDIF